MSIRYLKRGKPTRTYSVWLEMRKRCNSPKCKDYKNYGGRGIAVCQRWNDYLNFLNDMGEAPAGLTIDRIDNDADYSPDNCRWTTRQQNLKNRRPWGTNRALRRLASTL